MKNKPSYEELENQIAELKKQNEILELSENSANLNSLINNRTESIWSIDSNYNYISFNNFFKDSYFSIYNIELKKGLNALDILTPELLKFWKPKYDKALSGKKNVFEFPNQVDNELRYFQVSLNPIILDDKITGVSALSDDITERKLSEEKLLLYKAIIDASNDGIAIIDKQGYYLEQNAAHYNLIGYSDDELKGETPAIHFGAEVFSSIGKVLGEKGVFRDELISHTKNGKRDVDISAFSIFNEAREVICHAAIKRDITERKQIELELIAAKVKAEESEAHIRIITDNLPILISQIDENLKYLFANKYYSDLGLDQNEIIGKNVIDIIGKEPFKRAYPNMQKALSGEFVRFENHSWDENNKLIILETQYVPYVVDGKVESFFVLAMDITERKQAEKKTTDAFEMLSRAEGIAKMGSWSWNPITNEVEWSDNMCRLYGIDPSEFIPTLEYAISSIHPEDVDSVNRNIERMLTENKSLPPVEYRIITPENEIVWLEGTTQLVFDEKGEIGEIVGTAQDITERKQIELELIAAKEKAEVDKELLDSVLHGSDLGYWDWNIEINEVKRNRRWAEMLGYTFDEIEFSVKQWVDFIYPDDRGRVLVSINNHLEGNTPFHQLEYRMLTKNGQFKWILDSAKIVKRDKKGKPLRMSGTHLDITERKQAEKKMTDAFEMASNAEQSAKLGSWSWQLNSNRFEWSDNMCRLHGIEPTEYTGTYEQASSFQHPDDLNYVSQQIERTLKEKQSQPFEYRIITPSGIVKWIEVTNQLLFDEKGEIREIVGTVQDITERKQADELFQYQVQRNKKILETTLDGYVLIDSKSDIIDANPSYCTITGYSYEELVQLNINALEVKLSPFEMGKRIERVVRNGADRFESKQVCKNGQIIDLDVSITILQQDKEDFVAIFVRDISDHKILTRELIAAKEKAEESEIRFKALHNASFGGIAIHDKGIVLECNQGLSDLTGYSTVELVGMNGLSFIAEQSRDLVMNNILSAYEKPYEAVGLHKNGKEFSMRLEARQIPYRGKHARVVEFRDITDQKKTELAVYNQKKLFETMFNTITDGIVITNTKREIILANKGMKTTFGYKPDELLGKTTELLYADKGVFQDAGESVYNLNSQSSDDFFIKRYKDSRNHIFPGETFGVKLFDANNKYIGNMGIMRNISERQTMISDLEAAKGQAEESDRLKSAFLANMSHEIRTPMNGILGFADLLKEPNLTGEQQQKYIGIIETSGKRMLNIINDIVSISKIESGQMEVNIQESNINKQIEFIYTFFKPEVEGKGMQLSFRNPLDSSEVMLKTDREKVYAILTNLVKNAIKYSEKGSIELGYNIKGKYLEFYVKDTGIGIVKERQEAIFERFIQADIADKNAYQGAGLGLSISKAYIEMLDGKIWVESEFGKGSVFYFTLPYQTEATTENSAKNEILLLSEEIPSNKFKILIVEDDEISEALISITVRKFGKEIIIARTGVEAVVACQNNPDINLVMMDIQLPEMNGYEATRQIREFNKDIIIIAQTAYAIEGDRQKAIAAGCDDYLSKPIKTDELKLMINKYVKK